jgi:hypothetical protein
MINGLVLHHLKTPGEIATILPLREGIDLSALAGDCEFTRLEKKETSAALSAPSRFTVKP